MKLFLRGYEVTLLRIALVFFLFVYSVAWAISPQKEIFAVERMAGFTPVVPAIRAYLALHGAAKGLHHICVIGYVERSDGSADENKIAWLHWREGNRLTLWEPAREGGESKDLLNHSRRDLDISKDVLATQDDIGSSTYKVSYAWVDGVEKDCQKRGKSYVIRVR